MSQELSSSRRHMQAEHIVNSLKMRTKNCGIAPAKRIKKSKRRSETHRGSQSSESAQTPSDMSGLWFREDDGRVRSVQFLVGPPPEVSKPSAGTATLFSSMFREIAQKFKIPGSEGDTVFSGVFCDKENSRVYLADQKNGAEQFELTKKDHGNGQFNNNSSFLNGVNFDKLKVEYKLNYLY